MKQSLHFEEDCFEYKEYTAKNIVDAYIHFAGPCKCVRRDCVVTVCNFFPTKDFLIKIIYEESVSVNNGLTLLQKYFRAQRTSGTI